MDVVRIGWSAGVGVATALLGPLVPAAGAVGGILLAIDPLANGSLALLGRWGARELVSRWKAEPIPPDECPPIEWPKNPIPLPPPGPVPSALFTTTRAPITVPRVTLV